MSVLNRKLFNRGGRVSSRGVGITSGLVHRRRGYVIDRVVLVMRLIDLMSCFKKKEKH